MSHNMRKINSEKVWKITLIGPTRRSSNTISFIAKSRRSCAMNCIIFTNIFNGVSRGTTPFEPLFD